MTGPMDKVVPVLLSVKIILPSSSLRVQPVSSRYRSRSGPSLWIQSLICRLAYQTEMLSRIDLNQLLMAFILCDSIAEISVLSSGQQEIFVAGLASLHSFRPVASSWDRL